MIDFSHCFFRQGKIKRIKSKFNWGVRLYEFVLRLQLQLRRDGLAKDSWLPATREKSKIPLLLVLVARQRWSQCWPARWFPLWGLLHNFLPVGKPLPREDLMPQRFSESYLGQQWVSFLRGKLSHGPHKLWVFIVEMSPCHSCFSTCFIW